MKLVENMEDVFTGTQFEEEYKGLADLYKLRAFREDSDYYKGEKSQFRTSVVLTRGWEDVDTLKNAEKFFDFLFDSQLSGDKMAFVPSVVQICKELEKTEIKKEKRVYDEDDPSEYEIQEVVDTEIVKSVIEKIRAAILEIPENELTLPQIEVILTIIEDFGESGKNDSKQHFLELKEAVKSGKVISTTEKSADKKTEQEAAEKARKEEEERKKAEEEKKRREEEEAKIRFEEEKKAEEAKKAEEEKKRREEEDKKAEEDKLRQKRREERKKRTYPKSYQNQKEYEDGVKDLLERFADIDTDFMDKDGLEDYLEEAQKAGLDVNNPGIRNVIIILNDSDNAVLKENKNIKRNDLRNSEIEGLFKNFGTNMMSLSSKKRYKGRRDTKYDKFLEEYKEAEPLMTVIAKFENRLHLGASKKALDSLKLKAGEISDIKDTDKDNLTEYEKKARSILEGLSKERRKELAGKKYTDDITYDDFVQKAFLNGWELEKDLPFLELVFEKFTKLPKKTDGDKYNGVTSTVVSIFNSKAKTYRFKARVAVHAGNTTGMRDTFDDFANYYRREAVNDYLTRDDESVYKEAARAGWKEESDKEFIDALKIQYNKDIRNRKGESAIPDPNQKKQRGIPQKYDNDMQKLVKFFFGVFKTPKEKLDYLKAINWAKNNLVTEHRALAIYDKTVARYEEIVNPGLNSGNVIHDGQEDINAQKEADKKHIEEENRRREEEKARKEKEEAERRKAEEDAKKAEEERVRREEEERKRLEEENKRREEERVRKEREEADKRKAEEERKRIEEENKRREEEEKRKAEEERKRIEEENKRREEEEKRKAEEDRKRREEEEKRKAEEDRKRREEEEKRFEDEKFRNTPSMRLIPGKEKKETKAEIKSDKDFDEAVTELYDRINNYMEFNIPKVEGQDEFIKEVEKAGFDTSIPAVKKLLLVFHAKTVVTDKKGVADNILKKIKDTKKGSYFKSLSAILSKLDEVSRNFDPILHDTGAINAAKSIKGLLKNIEKYEPGLKDYDEKVIREGKITAPKELSQKEEEQPKAEEKIQKAEEKIQKAEEKIQKAEGNNKQADDGQIFETYKNGIKEILDKIQMLVIKSEYPGLEITKEKFNKLGLDVKTPGMEKLVILVNNLTHKKLIEDEIDALVYTAMEDELKNKKALPAELLETIFDKLTIDCGDRFTSIKCQAAKDKAAELAKYEKQHLEVIKAALKKEAQEKKKGSERKEDKENESAQPQKKENPIKQKQPEGMQEKDYFEDEDEENNINNINNINTSTKKTTADKNKKNDDDIPADKKKAIEYAKKYDQFMAVKQSMLEGLKSFKEGIINNAQKDKKLYRNLATMSDEQKTEAFLKDGSVYYRRMAKALEDCIKLLESGECHEGKIYKQFFELENRAIQYQEYNKPLLSPASHEYKTGSGKIRYRIAENFEKCAGMWRMEYSYLNRELLTLSGGGKKYATDEAKGRYAAELKDKYQLETEDMTEEQLKEYSKVSSLRSQFVNKVANDGFKEIIRFYEHYSHNRSADEYLTVEGAPDSIEKKAAWFVFKQEIDKIFAEDVTADEISKIIKSYSPERLKAKISRLKKDKVFKEVCTKNETGAFSKWEDIDLDSRKAAYTIKKTISTETEKLSGCFPLNAHLVNDVRETAATIIAESIMSKPENAEIIHRAYATENGKQDVLNDIQQLKFIASGYLSRKDLIKTDGSVTIANVAEKILYNDSIQKAILKEYHSKKKAAESKKNINDILLDGSQNEKNPVNMINDININTNTNMAPTFDLNKEKNNIIE
jgi:hypothetical protein